MGKTFIAITVGAALAVLVLLVLDAPREVAEPEVAGSEPSAARLSMPENIFREPAPVEATAEPYADELTASTEREAATLELAESDEGGEKGTQILSPETVDVEPPKGEMLRATVPALPGLIEFDILAFKQTDPPVQLSEEVDNPIWARPMEERILSEVLDRLDFPLIALHAVCRASMCGFLYAYEYDQEPQPAGQRACAVNLICVELGNDLADELGFGTGQGAHVIQEDGVAYTTIYLSDWTPQQE